MLSPRTTPFRPLTLCVVGLLCTSSGCFSDPFVESSTAAGSTGSASASEVAVDTEANPSEGTDATTAGPAQETTTGASESGSDGTGGAATSSGDSSSSGDAESTGGSTGLPADCEGTPGGDAQLDVCDICNGDGTSCLDCDGTPNGDAQLDVCDVCNGDGTSCLDCDGTPNGDAQLDECGVCNGIGAPCWGCTVPSASNFDPLATVNDGTCSCNAATGGISDQSNLQSNAGAGGFDQWQSFTVGLSGGLTQIDLRVSSPLLSGDSPGTLRVYEGEGFSGTLLGTQEVTLEDVFNTMQEFPLDEAVPMTAGAVYSFRLTVPNVEVGFVSLDTTNPYPGGRTGNNANYDLVFQTYVSQCLPE